MFNKYNLCTIQDSKSICNTQWTPRYNCKYYTKCIFDECRYRIGTNCHHALAIREAVETFESLKIKEA